MWCTIQRAAVHATWITAALLVSSGGEAASAETVARPSVGAEKSIADEEDETASEDSEQLTPSEIRERRHFRSKIGAQQVLGFPSQVLEIPWYPIGVFLDYSERTDLFTRVLDSFYFDDAHTQGWFPKFTFGGEFSNGFGFTLFDHDVRGAGHEVDFSAIIASEQSFEIVAGYTVPRDGHRNTFGGFETRLARDEEVEVFANTGAAGAAQTGANTGASDESEYGLRSWRSTAFVGREITDEVALTARVGSELARAFSADDAAVAGLDGFGQEILTFDSGVTAEWDQHDDPYRPTRGGSAKASIDLSLSPDRDPDGDRYAFTNWSTEIQYAIPLFAPQRTLVLRQSIERSDPIGSGTIPFYRLPVLDRNHGLRSFERNRFQDRGRLAMSAEYRFPIWRTWDGFLAFDTGQTFFDWADIDMRDLRVSGGGGIRFYSADKLLFLLQLTTGNEGAELVLQFGQGF